MEFLELRKHKTTLDMFRMFKQAVLERAAHSIGCDPSDLDDTEIIEYWNDGMSTNKASCEVENALSGQDPRWIGDLS